MCRRALLGLEPTPQAAGEARHFVAEVSRRWGIDDVIDQVTLAVSELVTNAVLHARTNIDVELCVIGAAMTVGVIDRDPRPPVIRPARLDLLADLDAVQSVTPDFDDRLPTDRRSAVRRSTDQNPTDQNRAAPAPDRPALDRGRRPERQHRRRPRSLDRRPTRRRVGRRGANRRQGGVAHGSGEVGARARMRLRPAAIRNAGSRMRPYRGVVGRPGGRSRSVAARRAADPRCRRHADKAAKYVWLEASGAKFRTVEQLRCGSPATILVARDFGHDGSGSARRSSNAPAASLSTAVSLSAQSEEAVQWAAD